MQRTKKITAFVLAIALCVGMLPTLGVNAKAADTGKHMDVLFTHDTHSHLNSFPTIVDGKQEEVGGFARLKTLIDEQKEKNPDTLYLDGGDFSMGTLIQTVYETEAAELRMLGYLGCDVTTWGNHEFDYRSSGLANMLNTAKASGENVPSLVVCNVDWSAMEKAGLTEGQQQIKDAFENYGVKDYVVVQKGDVKIAVFGVFGKDSLDCAPTCELLFEDPIEASKKTVEEIKKNEDVDMIACVSHSGTVEDEDKSEDEILAKNVPDIDLIISGHTHTQLDKPIQHGDTYIVSCGEYGRNLGTISMTQKDDGRWDVDAYELIPVTDEIKADAATQKRIDELMETVDTNYLSHFGYTKDQILAENDIEFSSVDDMYNKHEELNLGDIMSDAYVYAVENSEYYDGDPVDVAVVPSGTVRDTYTKGDVTVEQVYNSFSLGIGKDGLAGYPLISAYLTGKELKLVAEIDASVSDFMTIARLYCSGLNFTYNPHRMILNKVTDCYLMEAQGEGNREEIEDDKLYHVVTDLYTGQMLGAVMDTSYGLLSITPKDKDGNPIENLEDQAIMEGNQELKAWAAIARYMESFDDTDGDGFKEGDYYFGGEDDGAMTVGWLQMDITYDEATSDYEVSPVFNDDEDQTRWFYFKSNGKKIYAEDGDRTKDKTINGKKYAFDEYGAMVAEWSLDEEDLPGKSLASYSDAVESGDVNAGTASASNIITGKAFNAKYSEAWKYFNSVDDGARVSKGWFKVVPAEYLNDEKYNDDEDYWYYADGSGNLYAGEFKTIKGKKYAFRNDGRMIDGLKFIYEDKDAQSLTVWADDDDPYRFDSEDDFDDNAPLYEAAGYYCYYFGDGDDGAMRTNKSTVEIDGENFNFYFEKSAYA